MPLHLPTRKANKYRAKPMLSYVECPCCGDDGAESDANGEFYDGQPLICGCFGMVSVDEDGDVWINNGCEPCPCQAVKV